MATIPNQFAGEVVPKPEITNIGQASFDQASSETAGDAVVDTSPLKPVINDIGTSTFVTGESEIASAQAQDTGTDASSAAVDTVNTTEAFNIKYSNLSPTDLSQIAPGVSPTAQPPSADDSKSTTKTKEQVGNTSTIYAPRINPLHDFPSYTYGLTIHALNTDDYKTLVNNPKNFKFTTTLVSSASRYHATRAEQFKDDFYFEDFKIQTVIGLNANTRGTNGIDLSFTLIEPYGMTLINRLLDVSQDVLKCQNYLQVPYVLEINFFGYDDHGNIVVLKEHTKMIPFKFTGMKIRASVKGTEYQCTAVPFNHQAHFYDTQSVRANMEITAKTVNDFFSPDATSTGTTAASATAAYNESTADADKQRKDKNNGATTEGEVIYDEMGNSYGVRYPDNQSGAGNTDTKANIPVIKSRSFPDAYNAWFQALKTDGKVPIADEIAFIIDKEIAECDVIVPGKVDAKKEPTASEGKDAFNETARRNNSRLSKKTPAVNGESKTKQSFTINAGSSINNIIDQILTNSQYILKQLTDPETQKSNPDWNKSAENLSAALKVDTVDWYKIIPKVELLGFDPARQIWAKKTTFYIKKFTYYNTKDSRAPMAVLPAPVKDYEFLYTGKNRDIINFDMDFNALFYTAIQVDKRQKEVQALQPGSDTATSGADKSVAQPGNTPTPAQGGYVATDARNSQGGTNSKSETQNATSFRDSVYSQLNGDMLNLNLTIVGDPEFIKQDDILYYPDSPGYKGDMQYVHGNTGSLTMDKGEIYCRVVFKTPSDINEQTGGLRYYGNETRSAFSGMYRILTVESELKQGKFTQKLSLVRQQNQPDDGVKTAGQPGSTSRNDSSVSDKNVSAPAENSQVAGNQVNKTLTDGSQADVQPDEVPKPKINEIAPSSFPSGSSTLENAPNAPETPAGTAGLQDVAENGATVDIGSFGSTPQNFNNIGTFVNSEVETQTLESQGTSFGTTQNFTNIGSFNNGTGTDVPPTEPVVTSKQVDIKF